MRAIVTILLIMLLGAAAYAAETITYTYDARGRLVKVSHSGTVNNNGGNYGDSALFLPVGGRPASLPPSVAPS